jgi:hypothetical protein
MQRAIDSCWSVDGNVRERAKRRSVGFDLPTSIGNRKPSLQFHLPEQRAKSWMPMQPR